MDNVLPEMLVFQSAGEIGSLWASEFVSGADEK
jgi:hypothetical protein